MTTELSDQERLAAEHALRLLEGEEELRARGLMVTDHEFADRVAEWEQKLAPMLEETAPVQPSPEMWARIEASMSEPRESAEIVTLERKIRRWQWATGGMAAAAAVAIAFLSLPADAPAPNVPQNPLVASIPIGDTPLRLGVTYLPDHSEILVSASGLSADGVHDHELWLVPPDGAPQSLGVVVPGEERRVKIDEALIRQIGDGSDLILTREPLGGAPAGAEAGPTVASGEFSAV